MSRRSLALFDTAEGRATVEVELGQNSAWLRGRGVHKILDELEIPRMRDWHPDRKGILMCAADRVGDVLALLEHRDNRVVILTTVDR